jgi:diguanylate cyclase (GGDEF)-like protein
MGQPTRFERTPARGGDGGESGDGHASRAAGDPRPAGRPWVDVRARWRAARVLLAFGAALAVVAALRPLASPAQATLAAGPRLQLLYVLGLGLGVAASALLAALKGRGTGAQLALYAFVALSVDGVGQIAQRYGWQAWPPMALLVAAVAVAEPAGIALGVAALASFLAVADAAARDFTTWRAALGAALGYAALTLGIHQALRGEKRRLAGTLAELARVQFGVEQLGGADGQVRPAPAALALRQLSGEGRRARQADHAREVDDALGALVRTARVALRAHSVAYFDVDHERERAHLRAAAGPDTLLDGCTLPFSQDPLAFVVDRRQPFYATDFKRLLWSLPYYAREVRVGTLLVQPVLLGDAVGGVLLADRLEVQAFTGEEPGLIEAFAVMAAGTIQRLRAAFSREEMGLEFSAVYETSQHLRALQSAARVRHVLLAAAQNLAPLEAAAVVSTDGERYTIETALGWAAEFEGREVALSERTWAAWLLRSAPGSALVSELARERERMPALVLDESASRAESLLGFPLRVPLRERDELLGGLVLLGARGAFDAGTQRVLDMLVNQAAVALLAFRLIRDEQQRALEDGLTGLYNRRAFNDQLARALAQADRKQGRLTLLLLDVDHFKKLNDTYGHPAGDAALKSIARTLRRVLRGGDVAARYGGEEFVVILPDTDAEGGRRLAERARESVERGALVFEGASLRFTASFGLAVWPDDAREPEALLAAADRALYAAKQGGRNRVVAASSLPPPAADQGATS